MDDDLEKIMLYGLQSFAFCQRQFALEFNEQFERVNWRVADGRIFHEKVDRTGAETRKDVHVATALKLSSEKYGLVGIADLVEFHRVGHEFCEGKKIATLLPKRSGWWKPFPVEYKRGLPKSHRADEIQLCAQVFCLEEMLCVEIESGALFYGVCRRRTDVRFDDELRQLTAKTIEGARSLLHSGITPKAVRTKACEACSLKDLCLESGLSVREWLAREVDRVVGEGA